MTRLRNLFLILSCLLPTISMAAQNELNTLFEMVRESRQEQQVINQTREKQFLADQKLQQQRVNTLKNNLANARKEYKNQQQQAAANAKQVDQLQTQLNERTHSLRDLFSAWKLSTRETLENQKNSLLSSQYTDQLDQLQVMTDKKELPESSDLYALQNIIQQDITGTGLVSQFNGPVTLLNGETSQLNIQRLGPFTAKANGQFLVFNPADQSLSIAPQQPDNLYLDVITNNSLSAVIDPSRGIVLHRLALKPDLLERIQQGGLIGYVIIALGIAGLLLAGIRWLDIGLLRLKIKQQLKTPEAINKNNPLGRILAVYHDNPKDQIDSLEVKLQEAVLQEVPRLDKGLGTLKLLAAVAPLLGLLGTVVGMINTFQTITLVGSTDPKLMAGGISQALVTTVLGLTMTVPLLFSHSFVSSRVRMLMVLLSQQSLGIIAQAMEASRKETTRLEKATETNHD